MVAENFKWSFRSVVAYDSTKAGFVAGYDGPNTEGAVALYGWKDNTWYNSLAKIPGISIALSKNPHALVALGIDGRVAIWSESPQSKIVNIDKKSNEIVSHGDMREIRTIGEYLYAVGMGRTVYQSKDLVKWNRIDADIRAEGKKSKYDSAGLNSIHGTKESNLLAVGWNGEIWERRSSWKQLKSPSKEILYKVLVTPKGERFAAGQKGTLLIESGKEWRKASQKTTSEDFWSMTWFKNKLYLATTNGLFRLEGKTIKPVPIKGPKPIKVKPNISFGQLDSTPDRIWSMGSKMVIYSNDGVNWHEVSYS